MARNRVLSFMTSFSGRDRSPTPASPSPHDARQARPDSFRPQKSAPPPQQQWSAESNDSPQARAVRDRGPGDRASSRPMSMVQTYQPPLMELNGDTLPELQPIFTFLNSHGNKLYQEGYFLKLDDQNSLGKPNADRTWTECFAQLVGTILSLWDAAELDAAGRDGEVLPKFINLTDASIKIMEPLPTRADGEPPLQNVLSISTAGKNRYLLHFNSHHSLIQWTAGIRLAMYEYTTLQEAYTGALIAGKGKSLNNINLIMERSRFKHEEWVRVRFGAGTPWRRCWCVITPPDEKEYAKLQKELNKKKTVYDRSKPPVLKGDIKFYDTKKTKKVKPLAQITNAYSAFAIYPQSKPLIDQSTLVKVEGKITIHSNPPTSTEGFVFVMPETHAAVSGFEMMLRWLFPAWDTFAMYGRPGRLIADTLDPRSLMFAMPKERRYGYLEILDVTNLILTDGSAMWTELEWRRKMKELTQRRMTAISSGSRSGSRYNSRRNTRNSMGPSTSRSRVGFDDGASVRSTPSDALGQGPQVVSFGALPRTDSAPNQAQYDGPPGYPSHQHHRSVSESQGLDRYPNQGPGAYDGAYEPGPIPPPHTVGYEAEPAQGQGYRNHRELMQAPERLSGEDDLAQGRSTPVRELQDLQAVTTPEPVARPPAFSHAPGTLPASKPYHSPELRKANSRMSHATLAQMGGGVIAGASGVPHGQVQRTSEDRRRQMAETDQRGVLYDANNPRGMTADPNVPSEGVVAARYNRSSSEHRALPQPPVEDSYSHSASNSQQIQAPSDAPNTMAQRPPYEQSYSDIPPQLQSGLSAPSGSSYSNHAFLPVAPGAPRSSYEQSQGHVYTSSTESTRDLSRLRTSQSILRKPIPGRDSGTTVPDDITPETSSSMGSLSRHVIDQAAFDRVVPQNQSHDKNDSSSRVQQQHSNASLYEDAVSTTTPDYASTVASEPRQSVERPRAGVMRTVGGSEPNPQSRSGRLSMDIPAVDFGPTINYAPTHAPRGMSPARRRSPARQQEPTPQTPSNLARVTPEPGQFRPEPNAQGNRTVPWQPGMAAAPGANSPSNQVITPEQFVQQRATGSFSQYAQQRQQPFNNQRSGTPTPPPGAMSQSREYFPHSRNNSSDVLQRPHSRGASVALATAENHSRNNSADLLQRPSSRGAVNTLGVSGTGDYSTRLSAKEQEHVARVTGSPLINMAGNNQASSPGGGLLGTIEAREREKRDIKQGLSSQAVQQEIVRRQQQEQLQQQFQSQQGRYSVPQQYAAPGPQAQYRAPGPSENYGEPPQSFAQLQQRQSFGPGPSQLQQRPQSWMPNQQGSQQRLPTPEQLQRQQQEYYMQQQRQGQGRGR